MQNPDDPSPQTQHECAKTRLAESAIAAVDVSERGVMYVHLAALTLRLSPDALSALLSTLGEAVTAHTGRKMTDEDPFVWVRRTTATEA